MDIEQIILDKEQRPTKDIKSVLMVLKAISYTNIRFRSKKCDYNISIDQSQKQVSSVGRTHGFEVGQALYLKNQLWRP